MSTGTDKPQSGSAPCVAPTYPEWACTEEGDWVWVRLDLANRAEEIAAAVLDNDLPHCVLAFDEIQYMWLDREFTDWSWDWLLREVAVDADEAVAYVHYEVVDDERTVCEGCAEPIEGEPVWADMDPFCPSCAADLSSESDPRGQALS